MVKTLQDMALILLYPLALLGAVYAVCLGRLLRRLIQKVEDLHFRCRQVHQHLGADFLSAHRVEHQSLWEALHHHEHGPRSRSGGVIRIIGRQAKDM